MATRLKFVGDSNTRRFDADGFPREFFVTIDSYSPHAVNFERKNQIRYALSAPSKPDAIVIALGGNDIAYIQGRETRNRPPSDREIVEALKNIVRRVHEAGVIPILLPIHARDDTKYHQTEINRTEYRKRATRINRQLDQDMEKELGYKIHPYHHEKDMKLDKDGVHLDKEAHKEIARKITKHIEDVKHLIYNTTNMEEHKEAVRKRIRKQEEEEEEQEREERRNRRRETKTPRTSIYRRTDNRRRSPVVQSRRDRNRSVERRRKSEEGRNRGNRRLERERIDLY